ncbi:hypothetical protein VTO42DRAFT_5302 [Malbranchea cinnamomea]
MWYSILPEELTELEGWLIRFFIFLGTLTIGPWLFLILYDILLYIWRASTYEIPIIGGRARGRRRPVAPTLTERPDGRRRTLSLRGIEPNCDGQIKLEVLHGDVCEMKGRDKHCPEVGPRNRKVPADALASEKGV